MRDARCGDAWIAAACLQVGCLCVAVGCRQTPASERATPSLDTKTAQAAVDGKRERAAEPSSSLLDPYRELLAGLAFDGELHTVEDLWCATGEAPWYPDLRSPLARLSPGPAIRDRVLGYRWTSVLVDGALAAHALTAAGYEEGPCDEELFDNRSGGLPGANVPSDPRPTCWKRGDDIVVEEGPILTFVRSAWDGDLESPYRSSSEALRMAFETWLQEELPAEDVALLSRFDLRSFGRVVDADGSSSIFVSLERSTSALATLRDNGMASFPWTREGRGEWSVERVRGQNGVDVTYTWEQPGPARRRAGEHR